MPCPPVCARAQHRLVTAATVLLAACLGLAGCGDRDAAAQERGDRNRPQPVVVDTVREQAWTDNLRALGTVQAHESVTVTAKVSETVQQVHFESGQDVQRGAPLVTLSGQQQFAALASAEAAAKEAEALYQRQSQLAVQQLVSRAALDTQRATRDAARAQVEQIRANLADRVIRAPFAGTLGIRQVSPGALVTPGTVIATLDDISQVYVDFPVPETELRGVEPGQVITGRTGTYGEREFEGRVETVSARLDS
ncbi:MAG TPA: efflux RND transporter periplasmic adaptor subunit, partial [Xanthomonadaceae bacterium]|nr:efflux RND transporter periplasmic adaptor subunit [Xanthomonadaceae bacterium]